MGTSYFFVFGRTATLAHRELCTFFPQAELIREDVAEAVVPDSVIPENLLDTLGGTIKIARVVGREKSLGGSLASYIADASISHPVFGVSMYGGTLPKSLLSQIKKTLEGLGKTPRYARSRDNEALSSVVVDKQHVSELVVVQSGDAYVIAKTVGVQNYEAWAKRDYQRPRADATSGMLPPKVARMVVNIALGDTISGQEKQKTVYDPFCGMGTILAEAYMRGCRVMGSDISETAVDGTKQNLLWLMHEYPEIKGSVAKIWLGDATHASDTVARESVHAIVTEPFLGSTDIVFRRDIRGEQIRNILKGLEKLYIGCLRNWFSLLVPGGCIVIALPVYAIGGRIYFVKKVVDMCENLGYTIDDGPIEYSRPQAVVRRQFYILHKKN